MAASLSQKAHDIPTLARPGNSPIILLSYAYSGARRVQEALAADTELACTVATGWSPSAIWPRKPGGGWKAEAAKPCHRLQFPALRQMALTQMTTILCWRRQVPLV